MYEGVNVSDAGTLAALRGVGFGGYGQSASLNPIVQDGSAVNATVQGNRDIALANSTQRGQEHLAIGGRISDSTNILSSAISDRAVADRFSTNERIMFQQATDSQRDNTAILLAIKDVQCCCEANSAKIDNLTTLNAKDLQIQTLTLQLAACQSNGNGGPPGQGN